LKKTLVMFAFLGIGLSHALSAAAQTYGVDFSATYAHGPETIVGIDPAHSSSQTTPAGSVVGIVDLGLFTTSKGAFKVNGILSGLGSDTQMDGYYGFANSSGAINPPVFSAYPFQYRVGNGPWMSVALSNEFVDGRGFDNGIPPAYSPNHFYPYLVVNVGGSPGTPVDVQIGAIDPDNSTANNNGSLNVTFTGANPLVLTTTPEPNSYVLCAALALVGGIQLTRRRTRSNRI
jgi:hypothetical protein